MIERQLPQNIEAECGVLGSILIDPHAISHVLEFLSVSHFYRDAHRTIYEAMLNLENRREPADFITLCDELERKNKLDDVGGAAYLTELANHVPTSGNIEYYARIIERAAHCRHLIQAAGQIAATAYEQNPDALATAEKLIYEIAQKKNIEHFTAMPEMVSDYIMELTFLHEHRGAMTGVPSGYRDLDSSTGGFQKGDVIIIGGRPSSGKTAISLCIGMNAAIAGKKIAIFSLEMGKKSLMRRLVAMKSRVDMQGLRSGWIEDNQWQTVIDAASDLSSLPIFINDTAGNPISSMRSQLKRLIRDQGTIDMVIVDYLGLIGCEDKSENRVQEVSRISSGLKSLAREFDAPFLVLAQLSRKVEERANKRPIPADLRDSGQIEADADVIMFLYRDAFYAQQEGREVEKGKENLAEVFISKQRNGPTGDVCLYFHPAHGMFYDLEPENA